MSRSMALGLDRTPLMRTNDTHTLYASAATRASFGHPRQLYIWLDRVCILRPALSDETGHDTSVDELSLLRRLNLPPGSIALGIGMPAATDLGYVSLINARDQGPPPMLNVSLEAVYYYYGKELGVTEALNLTKANCCPVEHAVKSLKPFCSFPIGVIRTRRIAY
ncbi:uncharacterized protein MYCGRDRAFT_98034 [Zymoseptoria tritici IPO323]|uniref:Heterokaryon incompatibility domain-containing protein n=1 Tax=Zymoseptoria tritici (strain CBS 115943 / IPO323) TaxID=336722 RepID=F9XS45_ZYMTI|nr:uncharacterized protein MYCGRDRAFT_98034 [Zymoseptoria tritici IPO323]EGP81942.1 hypothetical protein MYCGRDRAFT_98034 [Zymoseptoria tritici IPO323]